MLKKYIQKIWEISDIKKAEVMIVKVSPLLLLLHLAQNFPQLTTSLQVTSFSRLVKVDRSMICQALQSGHCHSSSV